MSLVRANNATEFCIIYDLHGFRAATFPWFSQIMPPDLEPPKRPSGHKENDAFRQRPRYLSNCDFPGRAESLRNTIVRLTLGNVSKPPVPAVPEKATVSWVSAGAH